MQPQYNPSKSDYGAAKTDGLGSYPTASADGAAKGATALPPVSSKEFQNLFIDLQDLFKSATSLTGDELTRVKDAVFARVSDARKSLGAMGTDVAARSRKAAKVTDTYVRAKPWQSVGIGVAAGFLIGIGVSIARRPASRNDGIRNVI